MSTLEVLCVPTARFTKNSASLCLEGTRQPDTTLGTQSIGQDPQQQAIDLLIERHKTQSIEFGNRYVNTPLIFYHVQEDSDHGAANGGNRDRCRRSTR
jgi:hypothetical protein